MCPMLWRRNFEYIPAGEVDKGLFILRLVVALMYWSTFNEVNNHLGLMDSVTEDIHFLQTLEYVI